MSPRLQVNSRAGNDPATPGEVTSEQRVGLKTRPRRDLNRRLFWTRIREPGADRGSVSLVMVILTVAMFAMAGLVIDGGAALAARGKAADLAQEASRAGVSAMVPASLRGRSPSEITIDAAAADRAAHQMLASGDASGQVTVTADTVSVTAHVERRTLVLSAFGVTRLTGTATATATLVYGTDTGHPIGAVP